MTLIKNILMILFLTIFIVIAGCTLSAIANFIAAYMTISSVYIVIFTILITLKINERRN